MSLGSDGQVDRQYESVAFDIRGGDLIFSNGEWLHLPTAVATLPALLPKPADARMEASACEQPAVLIAQVPKANTSASSEFQLCRYYLYFPSDAAARAASNELSRDNFFVSVRRSQAGSEWLCLALQQRDNCVEPVAGLESLGRSFGAAVEHSK
jgi:hypothetical protein